MNKKQPLLNAITIVITGLENGTISHDWDEHGQCNLGLVAQAILEKSPKEIEKELKPLLKKLPNRFEKTWTGLIEYYCPVSGLSNIEIIKILQKAGLSREDMIHLEYLSNQKILEKAGIQTCTSTPTLLTRIGLSQKKIEVPIEDYNIYSDNLLKYLKAWKEIIMEELSQEGKQSMPTSFVPITTDVVKDMVHKNSAT